MTVIDDGLFDRDFSHVNNMLISLRSQKWDGGRNCQDSIHDIYHHVNIYIMSPLDSFDRDKNVWLKSITLYLSHLFFTCFPWSAPILERSSSEKLRYSFLNTLMNLTIVNVWPYVFSLSAWKRSIFYISVWSWLYFISIQCRDSKTEDTSKLDDKHILEKHEDLPLFLYTQKPHGDKNLKPTSFTTLKEHNLTMGTTTLCLSNSNIIIFCSSTWLSLSCISS